MERTRRLLLPLLLQVRILLLLLLLLQGRARRAPPASEGVEEAAAKAFKNLTALPVTNPALARCSVVKSPMTSSSISCARQNN